MSTLGRGRWLGRADVLRRVATPSSLGAFSYEPYDTKLARETRGSAILQLCLYAQLLAEMQGVLPEKMHVVPPGTGFAPYTFRVHDFLAYYRRVRTGQWLMPLVRSDGGRICCHVNGLPGSFKE